MADESVSPAGTRFSEDLRRIREERGISIQDIHQRTQIAETLIESFEKARLYDHPTYNRVYLRSFIRAYADAIGIPQEQALETLDAALEGTYDHALAEQYLAGSVGSTVSESMSGAGGDPDADAPSDDGPSAPTAGGPEGRGGIVGPPRAIGEEADSDPSSPSDQASPVPDSGSPSSAASAPDSEEEVSSPPREERDTDTPTARDESTSATTSEAEAGGDPTPLSAEQEELPSEDEHESPRSEPETPPEADLQDPSSSGGAAPEPPPAQGETGIVGEPTALGADPSDSSDEPASTSSPAVDPRPDGSGASTSGTIFGRSRVYAIGFGIAVVLFVLIGLGVAYFSTRPADDQTTREAGLASSPDTTVAAAPADTTQNRPPPAEVELGASIDLALWARSTVSGIRIQRDDDLRRPYWIQEGDADVFPFQERATIQGGLANVQVLIEGYPYPVQSQDTTEGLEITRSDVEAFVDTLRGNPVSLPASADTIAIGEPNS